MKDINQILREKEAELTRISREVEALRLVAPLLADQFTQAAAPPSMGPQRAASEPEPVRKRWP